MGPRFLLEPEMLSSDIIGFELFNPNSDMEPCPKITALLTKVLGEEMDTKCFERFSSRSRLTRAVARLLNVAQSSTNQHMTQNVLDGTTARKALQGLS